SQGEIVIRFTESSINVTATGNIKDDWILEFSCDKKAALPFRQIKGKKLSCHFKNAPYYISTTQGTFTSQHESGWKITPENQRIVLDFSSHSKR
ncbi:MAG: hypothetical protein N2F24_11160, partial [Deltaproteobacteria bacterium]